jgi:hypothetical protein
MASKQQKKPSVVVRDAQGRIVSGTPNPGGRPRSVAEVAALCREHTPAVIARLAQIVLTGDERASVAAAKEILDRGYGKASQHVEVTGQDGAPLAGSPDELRAKVLEALAVLAKGAK